jgi:Ni,Fe-hydrogenase I cytochrome b subunit
MKETIVRFLSLEPLNDHPMVHWGLAFVWLALVLNCVASIRLQPLSQTARWIWFLVILLLPILGMALYLLRCVAKADYSFLKFILGPPRSLQKNLVK